MTETLPQIRARHTADRKALKAKHERETGALRVNLHEDLGIIIQSLADKGLTLDEAAARLDTSRENLMRIAKGYGLVWTAKERPKPRAAPKPHRGPSLAPPPWEARA